MKKQQYVFLILIALILYFLYLIIQYKYKEYKINAHITVVENTNSKISENIKNNKQQLEYINTKAYKNKILKEEQSMKNKAEVVIFITNEDKYNKFSNDNFVTETIAPIKEKQVQDNMEIFEKWIYFLFKKDIR